MKLRDVEATINSTAFNSVLLLLQNIIFEVVRLPFHSNFVNVHLNGAIDERGVPAASTQAAIAQLEKLQRRFPNDPHRVLVAYMKGMAFATRWSGRPGYDRQLDEWLAMYKVVSRMMVNTDLPDHQADWIDVLSAWEPVSCTGERSRQRLMEQQSIPAGVLTQFLPWWTGTTLPCSVLDVYEVALPSAYAARWNADDALQVQSTPTPTPTAGHGRDHRGGTLQVRHVVCHL